MNGEHMVAGLEENKRQDFTINTVQGWELLTTEFEHGTWFPGILEVVKQWERFWNLGWVLWDVTSGNIPHNDSIQHVTSSMIPSNITIQAIYVPSAMNRADPVSCGILGPLSLHAEGLLVLPQELTPYPHDA